MEQIYDKTQQNLVFDRLDELFQKQNFIHVKDWLYNKINGKICNEDAPKDQQKCIDLIPNLRAQPIWPNNEFPFVNQFMENYDVIKQELINLRNEKGFQPYRGPKWAGKQQASDGVGSQSTDQGDWNVFYLYLHNMKFDQNCEKVPKTVQLIEKFIPRHYYHAFFSALTKESHIVAHHGPTNKKLRFHFPILGVDQSRLRVSDKIIQQKENEPYIFDDSFEHEAWHGGLKTRIVLIIDFWHPDLSDQEVKFFKFLYNSKMKYEKIISEQDTSKDNFYSIIEESKNLLKDNEWWE